MWHSLGARGLALYELRSIAQIHFVLLARGVGQIMGKPPYIGEAERPVWLPAIPDAAWAILCIALSLLGLLAWVRLNRRVMELSLMLSAAVVLALGVGFGFERYYTPSLVYLALGAWLFVEWLLPKPTMIEQ